MDWLALALVCAFSLASADAATKRWLADYRPSQGVMVRFGYAALFLLPLALWRPLPPVEPAFWGWVAALVPLELVAMWLYVRAISESPLSLTVPYLAFTPVFVVGTGYLILGETVSPLGFTGILLVVAGAWLLNAEHARGGGPWFWVRPFRAILRERGSRHMLLVAVIYAATAAMGKQAMGYASPESFGPFYFSLLGVVAVAALVATRRAPATLLTRRPGPHLLVGALMALMVVTHFEALARVETAYMIAVKRTSLLFGIVYGYLWFGEQRLGEKLAAGGVMVAGVVLIGW